MSQIDEALKALLKDNGKLIVGNWVRLIRERSETYGKAPESEIAENFHKVFDANVLYMFDGDPAPLEELVGKVVHERFDAGFSVVDVQEAMELFRTVTRPLILEKIPQKHVSRSLDLLDKCVSYSLRRLMAKFHAQGEAEAKYVNDILRGMLEDLKTERNNAMTASVLKDEFLANVSHELKTPLTSIMGFSKMMMTSEEQPALKEKAKIIYDQGRTLLRLINTLLLIAEINAGLVKMAMDAVDVRDVADMALQGIKNLKEMEGRKIEFTRGDEKLVVIGDSERLTAVFFELIYNGLKFSEPNGKVWVKVGKEKGKASLKVSDDGVGIDQPDINRIFAPFYQKDGSTTRRFGGSGLGLTMIKKVVELHGGTVTVESAPGKGSTFGIELPLAPGVG